jgi:hypothetical protein
MITPTEGTAEDIIIKRRVTTSRLREEQPALDQPEQPALYRDLQENE